MAKIWNTSNTECWQLCGETRTLSLLIGMQNGTATLEDSLAASYRAKHTLTIQSSNVPHWYLPKEVENLCPHKNLHMMFIAVLFIIAKTWTQPRCPSVGAWVNKMWYIQKMEYYSVLKRHELLSHEKTWRNLICILLKEANLKGLYSVWFQLYDILEKAKLWRQ